MMISGLRHNPLSSLRHSGQWYLPFVYFRFLGRQTLTSVEEPHLTAIPRFLAFAGISLLPGGDGTLYTPCFREDSGLFRFSNNGSKPYLYSNQYINP